MTTRLFAIAALAGVLLAGCGDAEHERDARQDAESALAAALADPGDGAPRSVILLIGDGMGPQQMALLMDWADAADAGPTQLQQMANAGTLGLLRTGAFESPCPDSAATATALASGIVARNGAIGVDPLGKPVRTCLEDARDSGRRTGLVTTTRLTHATPACFAAHVTNRSMEQQIAAQFINESGVDVLLGGGARFFPPAARSAAQNKGYRLLSSRRELESLPQDVERVFGVFSDSHIPFLLDRDEPGEADAPTLPQMTRTALSILARGEKGFFLMVEGGRIDHAGHGNDVAGVLAEMREFDETVGVALAFAREHPDVLVIATADHETGGLSVGYSAKAPLGKESFLAMASVKSTVGAALQRAGSVPPVPPEAVGVGRRDFYPEYALTSCVPALERSARFGVSYGTQGHTTTPVAVLAVGPGHRQFGGLRHNSFVGQLLRGWMQR